MKTRLFSGLLLGLSLVAQLAAGQRLWPAYGGPVIPPPVPPPPVDELVITNVNVVNVDLGEVEPNQMVVLREGYIISVGRWKPAGRGVPTLDGRGKYLVPGLWDGRVHALATAADEQVALPLYVAHGITSIRDVTTDRPLNELLSTYQALETGKRVGPRVEFAGPVLDGSVDARTGLGLAATRAEGRARASDFVRAGWCSLQAGPLLSHDAYWGVAAAAQEGYARLVGTVPEAVPVLEAVSAGQRGFEQADKLLLACSSREAELIAARVQVLAGPRPEADLQTRIKAQRKDILTSFSPSRCASVAQALVQYRAFVVPTLVAQDFGLRRDPAPDNPAFRAVPPAQRLRWAQAAKSRQRLSAASLARTRTLDSLQRHMVATFKHLGVRVVAGSDAGSGAPNLFHGSSLLDELEHLVAIGFTPADALRAATVLPAMATGRAFELGRIFPSYLADVVLLDANPLDDIRNLRRVRAVVLRGRVFDQKALAALISDAEQAALQNGPAPTATIR